MWYASLLLSANWSVTAQLTSKRKQPTSQPGISCQSLKASCTPVTSATVPCKRAAAKDAQFTFQFLGPEGAQITVPLRDYFVPIRYAPGLPRTGPDYDVSQHGDCEFKMTIKQGDILTLGKPFMRNAYTVYDQENHVFGLAQSRYSTDEDIVLFAKRGEPIPLFSLRGLNNTDGGGRDTEPNRLAGRVEHRNAHRAWRRDPPWRAIVWGGRSGGVDLGPEAAAASLRSYFFFGKDNNSPKEATELEATTGDRPRSGSPRPGETLPINGGELDPAEKRPVEMYEATN
ncbi:hypothetical protein PG996_016033 [Apiospora saccharicola]|uniref:Peptidase A1 domain-containing protein n=1 Tax=Apiospora saccharicola TaxID=335842 RepID=A0ABR1TMS5_9PEZI